MLSICLPNVAVTWLYLLFHSMDFPDCNVSRDAWFDRIFLYFSVPIGSIWM